MQAKTAINFKELYPQITFLAKDGNVLNKESTVPKEVISWYQEALKSSQKTYLVQYKDTYGLLAVYSYDQEYCDSDNARHSHVIRLAEAATHKYSSGKTIYAYGHNSEGFGTDNFFAFIPYGLSAKGILTNINTLVTNIDNYFASARESANELQHAFQIANLR